MVVADAALDIRIVANVKAVATFSPCFNMPILRPPSQTDGKRDCFHPANLFDLHSGAAVRARCAGFALAPPTAGGPTDSRWINSTGSLIGPGCAASPRI